MPQVSAEASYMVFLDLEWLLSPAKHAHVHTDHSSPCTVLLLVSPVLLASVLKKFQAKRQWTGPELPHTSPPPDLIQAPVYPNPLHPGLH